MSLAQQIEKDFVAAFKAKEETKISTLRMLKAALLNRQIEKRMAKEEILPDEEAINVLKTEVKKRKDSVESYRAGGRDDLVDKEEKEIEIISSYLPQQLEAEQILALVQETIKETGATSPADFGQVMGLVMKKAAGQAEGQLVSQLVKEQLSQQG